MFIDLTPDQHALMRLGLIDADVLDTARHDIAHHAHRQRQIFVH